MTRTGKRSRKYDADSRIQGLERRLSELEIRLADLEKPSEQKLLELLRESQPRRKRGRKPKYPFHIEATRNELLRLLEDYWPEFLVIFKRLDRPDDIRTFLEAFRKRPQLEQYQVGVTHLLQNLDTVLIVLRSDRYRSDPRSVANSLAGVPHVSWWRSLKVCGQKEYPTLLGSRVLKSYVERKYSHIARVFNESKDPFELAVRTKGMRTKDREISRLFSTADYAWSVWQSGRPDFSVFTGGKKTKRDKEPRLSLPDKR